MSENTAELIKEFIGKYCIVRSRDMGVVAGYIMAIEGRNAVVREARQLYSWSSKFVLIDLATTGPRDVSADRYSAPSAEPVLMTETCGILRCTEAAAAAIRAVPPQEH